MDYLNLLNEPQRKAVEHTEGPLMIIAGAGSGKTRVLTYRIAHLIQKGVDPFNILALTFTNKAAKEMRKRIEKVAGNEAKNIWMGTFHSVFAKILRSEAPKIGYPSSFTIYDTDDSKTLIRNIVKEMNLDDKLYKPGMVLGRISAAKNKLISVAQYRQDKTIQADDDAAMRPKIGEIYQHYQSRCFKSGAMDFDDLLFNTNVLFRDHPDALNKYQHIFKYVMVDEYQDTNYSQYLITRKLSAKDRNICVVGDDAQSIYAFRGADISNILNFERDYPELEVVKLEQNYRSTKNIVEAANSVIKNNKAQLRKSVFSDNEEGNLIEVIKANSDNEEGKLVAHSIFEEKMNNHLSYEHFAILYRTNAQSRAMEEALRKMNIKYRIVGGLSFYQRKEIKDLIAYMRLTVNHNDEQALRRVINYPKRGIGDSTIEKIIVAANETNHTIWEVISNIHSFGFGRASGAIDDFATKIKSFTVIAEQNDAFEAAKHIAKMSGIIEDLYADKSIEGLARYENIQELLNGIKEFVDDPEREDKSLPSFLQDIALLTDADTKKEDDSEYVTMMTIHSAKGLEFRNVYIVGMEENLFPSQMMITSRADLEEERRLFYVAITRAEKKLTLSYATSRYQWGNLRACEKSRFLDEIEPAFLNFKFAEGQSAFDKILKKKSPLIASPQPVRKASNYTPPADFVASDTSTLAEGMRVEHPKFGFGTVAKMDTQGNSVKAIIEFEEAGEKTLLLSFAKLRIHSNQAESSSNHAIKDFVIEETFSIPFKDISFKNGAVSFLKKFNEYPQLIEFNILNQDLIEEYDSIKNYFSNVLQTKTIQVTARVVITNNNVVSVEANSPEINKITKELIDNVKIDFVDAITRRKFSDMDKNLFTMDEYFETHSDEKLSAKIFYKDENQFIEDLIQIHNAKHYKHLRYLSKNHSHKIIKLRFVHSPFSFIFLLEGEQFFHIIWETLDTKEATYIWHIEKDLNILKQSFQRIEVIINLIKAQGKTAYLKAKEEQFQKITHDYSDKIDGFEKWKEELKYVLR